MDAHGNANGDGEGAREGARRRVEAPGQPRMLLQPFLLLALEQWQSHGYELFGRMSTFGFEALDRASVYRTLRQLEKDGLVSSGWDTSKEGPARRLYTLTDAGRDHLNMWAASMRGYQVMLNTFLTLHSEHGAADAPADREGAPSTKGGTA